MPDFSLLVLGRFLPGQVVADWGASTRVIVPAIEAAIDVAWQAAINTPGVRLFDGQVARLESFQTSDFHSDADAPQLAIVLSPTRYRIVVGTNFANPQFADQFGSNVMANPLGVSTGLLTADGFWAMGRRNQSVAYYPGRVHPFAGSLEVRPVVDIFEDVRRELREELAITPESINQIACLGLACDSNLRHPESVFLTTTRLTCAQIAAQLDHGEHDAVWFKPATPYATRAALRDSELTPIARATLLLIGRERFGIDWFNANGGR